MKRVFGSMTFLTAFTFWAVSSFSADPVPRMTKEELRNVMGNPDVAIVDVRVGQEWSGSDKKIQGAVRQDPAQLGSWMKRYPKDSTLVFYCS